MTAIKKVSNEESVQLNADLREKAKTLQAKFQRAPITDFIGVSNAMEKDLDRYIDAMPETERNNEGVMKKEHHKLFTATGDHYPKHVGPIETMGDILDHIGENLERLAEEKEIQERSAEEWRQLEHEYITRADFTLPDLMDDLLSCVEEGLMTMEELRERRRKFKPCEHRFCLNYFSPKRKDAKYCCKECRVAEKDANREFEKTSKIYANGTYLPVRAYKSTRDKQKELNYQEKEIAFDIQGLSEYMTKIEAENEEAKDGRTDRARTERRDRQEVINEEVKKMKKVTEEQPVKSFNIFDLSDEELKEKGLLNWKQTIENRRKSEEKTT